MTPLLKKKAAAKRAMEFIEPGMVVGLGTGSTAAQFIDLLGKAVKDGFKIIGIPTSEVTRKQSEALGIPLGSLNDHSSLDITVDGADEFDDQLRLIKGAGGAFLREKIVAAASNRMVVITDDSKYVKSLGSFPLPVEIVPFGLEATRREIEALSSELHLNANIQLRKATNGKPIKTDCGNYIFDCAFSKLPEPEKLAVMLCTIPGVVEHGLFIGLADVVITAGNDGIHILELNTNDEVFSV